MNIVSVTGNIGRDATLRQMGNGQYACFSVADSRKYNKDGQQQEKTTWWSCMKSDPNGKLVQYLTKGTKVTVTGRASMDEYQGNDGQQHTYLSIMVNDLEFMTGNGQQSQPQAQPQQYQPQQYQSQQYQQQQYTQPQRPPQNVKDLYDYATGGQAHNVRQNVPQTPNQQPQGEQLPF